jgi:hypothetical protein
VKEAPHVSEPQLWHVTLMVAGDPFEPEAVLGALERLGRERPFFMSGKYDGDRAELRYWDEAADCSEACALALRLWGEHRESALLPPWQVCGLEVVSRDEHQRRAGLAVTTGGWSRFGE